jgi:hypothetical protein
VGQTAERAFLPQVLLRSINYIDDGEYVVVTERVHMGGGRFNGSGRRRMKRDGG